MTVERAEVAIIGGGVIGASIAFHLARAGKRVVLVEKADLAAGSSGACDKAVFIQSKAPGIHLELALRSGELYRRLGRELDYDIEYHPRGGLVVIQTREQLQVMERFAVRQRESGLDVRLLSAEEARAREPVLSGDILAATYSPQDAEVNPIRLTLGFARAAARRGAKILLHTEAKGIGLRGGRAESIFTDRGEIRADLIINAAGAWAPEIGRMAGLEVPITPRRGQILVTEPVSRLIRSVILCARYITAKYNPDLARSSDGAVARLGVGLSLGQTDRGNILIGGSREFVGYDRRTTPAALATITRHALGIAPGLKRTKTIRAFAGLRPYTPDGLPILGFVEGLEGFLMAAGHEGDGIALAPITGQLIAELVTSGRTSVTLEPFRLSRFTLPEGEGAGGKKAEQGGEAATG